MVTADEDYPFGVMTWVARGANLVPTSCYTRAATCHPLRSACGVGNLSRVSEMNAFPSCVVRLPLRGKDMGDGVMTLLSMSFSVFRQPVRGTQTGG